MDHYPGEKTAQPPPTSCPHTTTVSKSISSFFCRPIPLSFISRGAVLDAPRTRIPTLRPRLLVSYTSKPTKPVIAPACLWTRHRGPRASIPLWARGRRERLRLVRALLRHFSSTEGGSNAPALSSSPHECFLFCCCHWEKTYKYWLCISHTHTATHTLSLQGGGFSPLCLYLLVNVDRPLNLDVGLWQALAVCNVLGWEKRQNKERPLVWCLTIMAAQLQQHRLSESGRSRVGRRSDH